MRHSLATRRIKTKSSNNFIITQPHSSSKLRSGVVTTSRQSLLNTSIKKQRSIIKISACPTVRSFSKAEVKGASQMTARTGRMYSRPKLKHKITLKETKKDKYAVFDRLYQPKTRMKRKNTQVKEDKVLRLIRKDFEVEELNNKINNKNSRWFRMHKFIHEKKMKNKSKYGDNSKLNYYAMPVPKGTISIMMNTRQKSSLFTIRDPNKPLTEKSAFKIKWKMIQWLWINKREAVINIIRDGKKIFRRHCNPDKYGITAKFEFIDLMSSVGLGGNREIGEKLFYVLKDPTTNTIDFRDLMVAIEIFRVSTPFDQKMKNFLSLCDMFDNFYINSNTVYNVLKNICLNGDERDRLHRFILEVKNDLEINIHGEFHKDEFYIVSRDHIQLHNLLEESIKNINKVDLLIENDIEQHFQTWIPMTNTIVKYKEGIHFPLVDQMLKVIKKNEDLTVKMRERKKTYLDEIKKSNADKFEDLSDDFDEFDTI